MKHKCSICNKKYNDFNMFHEANLRFDSVCYNLLNNYRLDNERVLIHEAINVIKKERMPKNKRKSLEKCKVCNGSGFDVSGLACNNCNGLGFGEELTPSQKKESQTITRGKG